LASRIGDVEKAYELYLRTSRLDLDDYNNEVDEGLHITSMGGTWMSIVLGFGGLRVKDGMLRFNTNLPGNWDYLSFSINFRGRILNVGISREETKVSLIKGDALQVEVNRKIINCQPEKQP
jgi:maltose phosphorylase